jgi:hypothetical protein
MVFGEGKIADNFRSALFQTVVENCDTADGQTHVTTAAVKIRQLQVQCVDAAVRRILELLKRVSPHTDDMDRKDLLRKLARMAMELALQFGVHTDRLELMTPKYCDLLTLGTDCRVEGDSRRYVVVMVDLAVSPGLIRIRGGERITIVPCDVILAPSEG